MRLSRLGRRAARAAWLSLCLVAMPVVVRAQVAPQREPRSAGAAGTAGTPGRANQRNSAGIDTAKARRDSLRALPLVKWEPADSVGEALLRRPGFNIVRYKANNVQFGATDRKIILTGIKGERAAVQRDPTVMVADTIVYSDEKASVVAAGDTITLRDPSRNDDVVALCGLVYDLQRKEGTACDVSTSTKSGETWFVTAHKAAFSGDTTAAQASAFYGRGGTITSCDDTIPHYHFKAGELKRIAGGVMVARPAVLYIQGVPVMWLPFIFQDGRNGRRSGILTPRFGLTELVRNSPTYRRTVENVGYYFALSDYFDLSTWMDWRSAANATDVDPGWVRYGGTMNYRWLNRFISGRLSVTEQKLSSGSSNFQLSWNHSQDFSARSRVVSNINYSSNTTVQRQTVLNPLAAVASIASALNYTRDMGYVQMSLGGTQRQYPGRQQIDRDAPNLNLTSKPINLTSWLLWTPSFSTSSSSSQHLDAQGDFSRRYFAKADGTLDSTKTDRNTRTSSLTFTTPFKLTLFSKYDFAITTGLRAQDRENDFPEIRTIVDPVDTAKRSTRVYARTYLTTVDFDFNVALPNIFQGGWNFVPSFSISNIDPGAYFVRSERTGSRWASQGKRITTGASLTPTFYAFIKGFGPLQTIRNFITPTLSYGFSPAANVNTDYLTALGKSPVGYLGSLAQNRVTLTLNTGFEGKLKQGGDSMTTHPELARKVKMLNLNFTSITYDFERARATKGSGFATDQVGYSLQSDLLPGFDFGSDYSLFQGSVLSDTAKFSPYLTSVRASMNLNARSPIVQALARLFGMVPAAPVKRTAADSAAGPPSLYDQTSTQSLNANVAGQQIRQSQLEIPTGRGFDASFSFSKTQQRPPVGGRIIQYDASLQCLPLKDLNTILYQTCVTSSLSTPPQNVTNTETTQGGSFIRYPPQTNIQFRTNFNLTPKWATSWSTNYDVERSAFGSQTVSLQRDLHDWRAVFGFTQAPNGNFAFTFFVSLKAEPDIKFNYDRSSFRGQSGSQLP